ncbi:MAG: hypothetical protein Fur0043_24050 [Anaerolineales bacterium]
MEQPENFPRTFDLRQKPALAALLLSLSPIVFCGISIIPLWLSPELFHYGPTGLLSVCSSCLGVLAPLMGITLGGIALGRKDKQKFAAIFAIVLGVLGVVVMGFVLFVAFTLAFTAM